MDTPRWHFPKHLPEYQTQNPLSGEHFSDSGDDWKPGESLVRECIQNSLDAALDEGEPVRVHFRISKKGDLSGNAASFWFGSLWPHLRAKECMMRDLPAAEPCSGEFIVVEDLGTRGLEGDHTQSGLAGNNIENRFFNFFRADGLTGNHPDETSGGSWGVGKSVFNRCSRINAFLALTVRGETPYTLLMGKAVLREHLIDGVQYKAVGLFGCTTPVHGNLVLPSQDQDLIARFAKEFQISRSIEPAGHDRASGLSIVIPYPDPDITADGIREIVIRQYFYPILAGRLAVRISDGRSGSTHPIDIGADSIYELAEQSPSSEILGLLRLSQWSMSGDGGKRPYVLERPPSGQAPMWDEALLRPDDPAYEKLCKRFDDGEPVAFRLPLSICPKDGEPEQDFFSVYLQRDLEGSGYRPVFVRDRIVVPNVWKRSIRGHRVFALVIIEAGPLAVLLKAAEPPAHTYWDHKTANFKGRYNFGKQVIEYVMNAPRNLVNAISSRDTEPDFNIWADLFPAPDPEGKAGKQGKKRKGKRRTPTGPINPPKSSPPGYRVDKLMPNGFAIVRADADKTGLPQRVRVRLGYATSKGDPIKKYHPADFDLSNLSIMTQSCRIIECDSNTLVFEPESEDFRIAVTGFDSKRDLCVKPRAERSQGSDEA